MQMVVLSIQISEDTEPWQGLQFHACALSALSSAAALSSKLSTREFAMLPDYHYCFSSI